jgi:hypothetical protein
MVKFWYKPKVVLHSKAVITSTGGRQVRLLIGQATRPKRWYADNLSGPSVGAAGPRARLTRPSPSP